MRCLLLLTDGGAYVGTLRNAAHSTADNLQHVFSKICLSVFIRKAGTKVTPWIWQLFAVSLPRIPGFNHRPVRVEFVMDKVALRHVSIQVLPFTPVSIARHCSILILL
jgi:hypothetical protein